MYNPRIKCWQLTCKPHSDQFGYQYWQPQPASRTLKKQDKNTEEGKNPWILFPGKCKKHKNKMPQGWVGELKNLLKVDMHKYVCSECHLVGPLFFTPHGLHGILQPATWGSFPLHRIFPMVGSTPSLYTAVVLYCSWAKWFLLWYTELTHIVMQTL